MPLTIRTIEYKCTWCGATEFRQTVAGKLPPKAQGQERESQAAHLGKEPLLVT